MHWRSSTRGEAKAQQTSMKEEVVRMTPLYVHGTCSRIPDPERNGEDDVMYKQRATVCVGEGTEDRAICR